MLRGRSNNWAYGRRKNPVVIRAGTPVEAAEKADALLLAVPLPHVALPTRRQGAMRGQGKLVRAEGLEPSRTLRSNGFSCPSTAFAAPAFCRRVWGLDYPFTMSGFGSGCQVLPV